MAKGDGVVDCHFGQVDLDALDEGAEEELSLPNVQLSYYVLVRDSSHPAAARKPGPATKWRIDDHGAMPVTVQVLLPVSPAAGYGGWLNGAGVTSSARSVNTFSPITRPRAGMA